MDNSKMYLLKRIAKYKENGYNSFGELNGKHVDDIAKLMNEFAYEIIDTIIPILNKGEAVDLGNGRTLQLNPPKKRKAR